MKIVKEDQNSMVIKDRNILAFFVGVILALVGFLVILKPKFFTNKLPLWFGFIWILIGLFLVFVAEMITITLDKNARKLMFRWKTLIKEKSKEYDLDQIKQLELQQAYTSGGNSYKLIFILNTSEEVPLGPSKSSIVRVMGRQGSSTERLIGTRIANFLDIPFQERRPPTVSEVLSTLQQTVQKEIEKHKKE